jgi:hypothetical protein
LGKKSKIHHFILEKSKKLSFFCENVDGKKPKYPKTKLYNKN